MANMWNSLALLLLRVGFGGAMLYGHGLGKLMNFRNQAAGFADPLEIGPRNSLMLAIFAEFFCSILVILGLATRLAAIPLIATMLVALAIVHRGDSFDSQEKALLYLVAFVVLLMSGGGSFALDRWIFRRKNRD